MTEMNKQRRTSERMTTAIQNNDTGYAVDFTELIYHLFAGWRFILIIALVAALIVSAYTLFFVKPMYEATSTIYVLSNRDSAINLSDLQLGTALTQDYIKVFQMWEVHEEVIVNLDLPYSYTDMQNMLSVVNDTNTRMIDITVSLADPVAAADIANEYAKVASAYIADTMATDKPNIMSVARIPSNPSSPNRTLNAMIGLFSGALFACAWIVVKALMNDTYKTAEDIRRYTGWPTLAIIPVETTETCKKEKLNA